MIKIKMRIGRHHLRNAIAIVLIFIFMDMEMTFRQ